MNFQARGDLCLRQAVNRKLRGAENPFYFSVIFAEDRMAYFTRGHRAVLPI
jgi:hypothetical protein